MARAVKQSKRPVRGRGSNGSKKVLRSKKQERVEDQPESDHEVRTSKVGVQGINQVWSDVAVNLYLSTLTFSISQATSIGLSRENVTQIGLSYFVRLFDSLAEDMPADSRRKRLTDMLDMYFLAGSDTEGAA